MRIEAKKLNYNQVVAKYPQFKPEIDEILTNDGCTIGADGWAVM